MKPIDRANFQGTYWKDIDWDLPIHIMERCTGCGIDSGEAVGIGHLVGCPYGSGYLWTSSEAFFQQEIKAALRREGRLIECDHDWRSSDSSFYDLVCTKCGVTD